MRREDFEHVIAAAAVASGEYEIVVIGSQAILGTHPEAPGELQISMEADVYPRHRPEKADEIDRELGDGSPFHRTYGYYAHGVSPDTAKAPAGWERRLVKIKITPRVGQKRSPIAFCLEPHDLVLAKSAAGRARDWDFAREALRAGLVEHAELERRIGDLPIAPEAQDHIRAMLEGIARKPGIC